MPDLRHDPRASYLRGVRAALPFAVVIVPFAMLFGLLASEAGLQLYEIVAFSVSVFAGASQFAALHLLQDQAPLLVILATSLAVNLRMLMYSVTLAPHLGAAPLGVRAAMAYLLVDQSFALSVAEYDKRPGMTLAEKTAYFFGAVTPVLPLWMGSTVAGAVAGRAIPPEYALGFRGADRVSGDDRADDPQLATRACGGAVGGGDAGIGSFALWDRVIGGVDHRYGSGGRV